MFWNSHPSTQCNTLGVASPALQRVMRIAIQNSQLQNSSTITRVVAHCSMLKEDNIELGPRAKMYVFMDKHSVILSHHNEMMMMLLLLLLLYLQ